MSEAKRAMRLKELIAQKDREISNFEGAQKQLEKRMNANGVDSVSEAEKCLEDLEKELDKLEEKIVQGIEEVENLLEVE